MKIDQKENLCNTMITSFMASAKQIKARKAFVKKYAKKGKRSKSKKSNPHPKEKSKSDFLKSAGFESGRYSILATERKQTKNLDVRSPPPESYKIVIGKTQAKKVYAEKKKLYHKVKMVKWDIDD